MPIVGNIVCMTLREYIATGAHSIAQIGQVLGVSDHAVRKWVYGQREPDLTTALKIEVLTGGRVTVSGLQRSKAQAA